MPCPRRNATEPIWRVLACSDGISSWTPLKPQHSNPNPNPWASQLWFIDFLTLPTRLIIPHRLPAFLESLMLLKNWYSIHARWSKSSLKHSIRFCDLFPSLKHNFFAYRSSKVSDWILEFHQLWQLGFSRVYSNCCCSCSFEAEIIKIGHSSHKIYSNKILNFQESKTIINAHTKKVWKLILCTSYIYIYIYIYIYMCVCVCVCVCVYVWVCVCVCVCVSGRCTDFRKNSSDSAIKWQSSEISEQFYIPWSEYLIYWKWYKHMHR